MRRQINKAGFDLIRHFEGLRLKSYLCPANVWTVGYGSTGPHVKPGMVITREQADELLQRDLERFERGVAELAPKATDNQFAALVAFSFNVGLGALKSSTLLKLHNAGDYAGAQKQFTRWNRGGGKILAGLTKRREAEAELYARA